MVGERQKHGFDYEQNLFDKFNIEPSDGYTSEWDRLFE